MKRDSQSNTVPLTTERWRIYSLRMLVALGFVALLYFFSWWRGSALRSPWLAAAFGLAAIYSLVQFVGSWLLYLVTFRRPMPLPSGNIAVDVFVTAYHEPYALVERALTAACKMRGVHRTWLLDDSESRVLARLAQQLGVGYLTRTDHSNAKAGNLNAALARTSGDIVVIFDVDHAPAPNFLERTLGFFSDPACGFVQVMLTFRNERQSWVARSAAESSLDFYNPTAMGMDGVGGATLVGSNAVIRRRALESIGGYRSGLAEDLATSIELHAAGWRSVYVAEPLADGFSPPDLAAWFTQQLKWARGVFEVLLKDYPRLFPRLTWGQRLAYSVRMTYYWAGPFICVHLFITLALLLHSNLSAKVRLQDYLVHLIPLAVVFVLIRQFAIAMWHHPTIAVRPQWRASALVFATWPVYTLAWIMAVFRIPLGFRLTPKARSNGLNPFWLVPQILMLFLLGGGIVHLAIGENLPKLTLLLLFALTETALQAVLICQWFTESHGQNQMVYREATEKPESIVIIGD